MFDKEKIEQYLSNLPPLQQSILLKLRNRLLETFPNVNEVFSYQLPALKDQKVFFFYGAFQNHIGIYPPLKDSSMQEKLKAYQNKKGNLQFPINQEIPYDLIIEVALRLHQQAHEVK